MKTSGSSRVTRSARRYILGTTKENRVYLFTELGPFKSVDAAKTFWRSKPRNGTAYVFEECDLSKYGVCFGLDRKFVATA